MAFGKELMVEYFKQVGEFNFYSPGALPYGCPNPKYFVARIGHYEVKLVPTLNKNYFLSLKIGMSLIKEWERRKGSNLKNDIKEAYSIIVEDASNTLKILGEPHEI